MLVGGLVVLEFSINKKKFAVFFSHIRSLVFVLLAWHLLLLIIALEEAIFMVFGLFLKASNQVYLLSSVFLGEFNLEAGPCPCVDLNVLLSF